MRRLVSVIVLLAVAVSAVFSKSIAVQIVQNSPEEDSVFATSYLFEQNIIDFFFDAGYIVSNSDVYIKSSDEAKNSSELSRALMETLDGGMEYLVRVEVEFGFENSTNPEAFLLDNIKNVTWTNYSAASGTEISSGSDRPRSVKATDNNEQGITGFSSEVASKISSGLGLR